MDTTPPRKRPEVVPPLLMLPPFFVIPYQHPQAAKVPTASPPVVDVKGKTLVASASGALPNSNTHADSQHCSRRASRYRLAPLSFGVFGSQPWPRGEIRGDRRSGRQQDRTLARNR